MNHKILIVDDDQNVLKSIERSLFDQPYSVTCTTNPLEALELVKKDHFAVLISDMRMPEMTGVELMQKIDQHDIKIIKIIISGFADMDSVIQAINQGHVWRYISKPFDQNDFKIAISNAIGFYDEKKRSETYQLEIQQKNLELETLNKHLEEIIENRTKDIHTRNEFLKSLAEMDTPDKIINEIVHAMSTIAEEEFILNMDQKEPSLKLYRNEQIIGYLHHSETVKLDDEKYQRISQFLPVLELACSLNRAKRNSTDIIKNFKSLMEEI